MRWPLSDGKGDGAAPRVLRRRPVIATVDPQLLVLGGSVGARPDFADKVARVLRDSCARQPVEVRTSTLGQRAGVVGALSSACAGSITMCSGVAELAAALPLPPPRGAGTMNNHSDYCFGASIWAARSSPQAIADAHGSPHSGGAVQAPADRRGGGAVSPTENCGLRRQAGAKHQRSRGGARHMVGVPRAVDSSHPPLFMIPKHRPGWRTRCPRLLCGRFRPDVAIENDVNIRDAR